MHDLLERPSDFRSSILRASTSVANIVLHGHRASKWNEFWAYVSDQSFNNSPVKADIHRICTIPLVLYAKLKKIIVAYTDQSFQLEEVTKPGSYLPTTQFPILKLIPDNWVPSRGSASKAKQTIKATFEKARRLVEERRTLGDVRDSLLDRLLDGSIIPDLPLTDTQVNTCLLGTLHQGASETSSIAVATSILFLAKNQDVQAKAKAELDRICGIERMPQWEDSPQLPYISCIVKEGLRIRPV
jgi:hypothetical protein